MKKRVFIVHGWGGNPDEGWFPWLNQELTERGFDVYVPQLPHADSPRIPAWVPAVARAVGAADQNTYFVGHSMGCQAIVRYLASLPPGIKVGGAVFVAGFFKRLTGLENDQNVQETDRHWLNTPLDFAKARSHLTQAIAIFSDNDPFVPLDNQEEFKDRLGAEVVIEHNKNHFSGSDGMAELPVALHSVLKIAT